MVETMTMKDIARLAEVSCATVSRVLNGDPRVREASRKRVLQICRQYGYRRNLRARSLSSSRTGLIGCVLSDLGNPLFAELSLILEQLASQQGYHVLFCYGRVEDADIHQVFDFLIGHRVDGIILVSSSKQAPPLIQRYMDRVPIVLQGSFDAGEVSLPIPTVSIDNMAGGSSAAAYLHRLGHRRVVFIGVRENNYSITLRQKGFLKVAEQVGMEVKFLPNETHASTIEVGYRLAKKYFLGSRGETAIFAACDSVALGVMAAAKEFYIEIPKEFSLLSFDNISCSALPKIRLSTYDHQMKKLVETTLRRLLEWLEAGEPMDVRPILVPPVLLERATCREYSAQ